MIRTLQQEWKTNGLRVLLTPVVVLAVLLLAAQLGSRATPRLVQLVALVLGGVLAFFVLTRRPEWGLLALLPISFLVSWEIGTGTKVALNATFLLVSFLLGVWVLHMVVIDKKVQLAPSRVNVPALAFALATTISLVAGNLRWITLAEPASLPAQAGGWALYALPMGLLLLVGNQIHDKRWLQAITWLFLAFGGLYMMGRIIPGAARFSSRLFAPASTDSMFWIWLAALAFGQCLLNRDLAPRWRLVMGLLAAVTLYVAWFQTRAWVSGWLPPLIAIGVIIWLRSRRWGFVLTIAVGVFLLFYYPTLSSQVMTVEQEYSTTSRIATWPIMWELVKISPILGLGPSNYYHYTPLYSLWGWYVKFNSHNNYLDILAQTGLVGLGTFVWLSIEVGWLGWRLRKQVRDGFSQGYVAGALGGLVATLASGMMADWFLRFVYMGGIPGFRSSMLAWLFLGGLVSLETIARGSTEDAPENNQKAG